jgi:hypothetical protein
MLVIALLLAAFGAALATFWPPADASATGWPNLERRVQFRCDLAGVRVPGIERFGKTDNVFTIFYPLYPGELRADIRRAMKARGYSHVVLDPHPRYRDLYPSEDLYDQPARFKAVIRELLADGLLPIVMLEAQTPIRRETPPAEAVRIMERRLAGWRSDGELMNLIKIAATGWEVDDHQSPATIEALARHFRTLLPEDAVLFVHFTPRKAAGNGEDETARDWWGRMARENVLDGLLYQYPGGDGSIEEFARALTDLTARFVRGDGGWPTRTGRGTPLYVQAFEYSAYFELKRPQWTEEWSRSFGEAALAVPGVSGFCDGGREPKGPPR